LFVSLGGARGAGSLLLLAAIVAGAVRLIEAVGLVAEGRGIRFAVVAPAAGLVCLVAAGATHVPLLLAGLVASAAIDLFVAGIPRVAITEPVELLEAPVSRAA
jgi:hypothetical protein